MARHLSRRTLLAWSAAAPLGLVARRAVADETPHSSAQRMATIGIAAGQIARLSLFHHLDQVIRPCGFQVDFLGVDGKLVATGKSVVLPGQGAFLDFDLAAGLKKGDRRQVHCNVTVPPGHENHIGATLELFDAKTGETTMTVRPCGVLPAMGTVGIVPGQVARLSLFHHLDPQFPPTPCNYKIEISGLDGKLLAINGGTLVPGQGAFFDYDLGVGMRKGERVQFHAMVRMPPGHELGSFVEIFDQKGGGTNMSIRPCGIEDPTLA